MSKALVVMSRHLLILGCSSTKLDTSNLLPALTRYAGPFYKVINNYLRNSYWPKDLSIGVLSAKYGLIGGLTPINYYDLRMDKERALAHKEAATETLLQWSAKHTKLSLILGKDYLPALNLDALGRTNIKADIADGGIGVKLNYLHNTLRQFTSMPKINLPHKAKSRPLYFLPDWDDMLDVNFDFKKDKFSHPERDQRIEKHCSQIMKPDRICDGILVSLAQHQRTTGVLKKFEPTDIQSLAPESIREKYGLAEDQWAFGDCGAFSYVNEERPTITVEQAISMYQLYGFDIGASVDHIPVPEIITEEGKQTLSLQARQGRVTVTKNNAIEFIELHKERKCTFTPMGVMQGLTAQSYGDQLLEYIEMGYSHIALGGLVPRSDKDIVEIIEKTNKARKRLKPSVNEGLWIHLFGIFRPKIQDFIQASRISSFDSATYFRKAWLRSDQNYLGTDGEWYAAIRVPTTSDPRTIKRLEKSRLPINVLQALEKAALKALHSYGKGRGSLSSTLDAIANYDFLLDRSDDHGSNLIEAYERTLRSRIWEKCPCSVCKELGINALIFRGYNRNKRRGAHNTRELFRKLKG